MSRSVMNISLPIEMVRELKQEAKSDQFSSLSEFMRHLIRERKRDRLAVELHEERRKILNGESKLSSTLSD